MMNDKQAWEVVAESVDFPVVAVVNGALDPPRIAQWGGGLESPTSVTLSHEMAGVEVTTYRHIMWGGEVAEVWEDLTAFVESSFGFSWEASGSARMGSDRERRARRQRAAASAEHRAVKLPLDGSLVQATVVSNSEIWSAGFDVAWKGGALAVLLSGRASVVDTLELQLVDDLLDYLYSTQAE